MEGLWKDLRYGARLLAARPGFTIVAVLTLALGIGANTAIFSVVNTVLLRPLPYKDPGRLVGVWDIQPQLDRAPASYPEFLDWRDQKNVFEEVGAYFDTSFALTGHGDPESLAGLRMSANLLPMLGLQPAAGRGFAPEEEPRQAERVAMIGYSLWQRRFGELPDVIGEPITLDGESFTVVGILPRVFRLGGNTDVAVPLRLDTEISGRGLHYIDVLGRLRAGITLAQARAEMDAFTARLRAEDKTDHGAGMEILQEQIVAGVRPTLLIFLGAVGFVLLIACTNVANLLLARSAARQKEIAVRLALGAGRGRLARQFLTESCLLALMGGGTGIVLAWWGIDLMATIAGTGIPRLSELRLDGTVLAYTAGLSVLTGLLFGTAPALNAASSDLHGTLKEAGRHPDAGSGRQRLRAALVVLEVALSMILLIGAGLLIRSFSSLLSVGKGFDPDRVIAVQVSLKASRYPERADQARFFDQVLARVQALPGVEAASLVSRVPLGGGNTNGDFLIEGKPFPPEQSPLTDLRLAGPDYFRVMRIPVLAGRAFTSQDGPDSLKVAIVNETFTRRFFAGEDPIGRRIDAQWGTDGWQVVVGVVGDVKHEGLDQVINPEVYLPFMQRPDKSLTIVARSASSAAGLAGPVREQVLAVDKDQPVTRVKTMDQVVAASVMSRRLAMSLAGVFAGLALFLSAVGIYGVLSFSVAQRSHEIGIRMALGARRQDVLAMVLRHGMSLTGLGAALGLAGAAAMTRLMSSLLFGISPIDPVTFTGIPLVLAAVALLAMYLPARRATRVDPMVALRYE